MMTVAAPDAGADTGHTRHSTSNCRQVGCAVAVRLEWKWAASASSASINLAFATVLQLLLGVDDEL